MGGDKDVGLEANFYIWHTLGPLKWFYKEAAAAGLPVEVRLHETVRFPNSPNAQTTTNKIIIDVTFVDDEAIAITCFVPRL